MIDRLPTDVIPVNYNLHLRTDLENFNFTGFLIIEIFVEQSTSTIIFNALDLNITEVSYTAESKPYPVLSTTYDKECVFLTFDEKLPIGNGILTLSYTGKIGNDMRGFYRSRYITSDGLEGYAGITQFESTDARRAFPCWDEPSFKSTFDITINAQNDLIVLSNMPAKKITDLDGTNQKCHSFETTPIMSTYLVAWVIGQFDYIEDTSLYRIRVRVFTPLNKKEQGEFALKVAVNALMFFEDFFSIPYPLPKLDLIAIPDFAAGAMENWGLVTYREICLLIDPNNSSSVCKQHVALVVCHELAHQWFGNLVTMKWWSDLWLKEGFAQFMEYQCVNYLFPGFKIWDQFVIKIHNTALELDSLKSSHPIEVNLKNAAEIEEIYDEISYNKGASLIRMLHSYLGNSKFRSGLNIYLERNLYKATETDDLWAALEEASAKPVASVMKTWTRQMGFPVILVATEDTDESNSCINIGQKQFSVDGCDPKDSFLWMVPINIIKESNSQASWKSILLDSHFAKVDCENFENQWIKLNPEMVGFYRVNYEDKLIEKFLHHIKNKTLSPIDRLSIQNDLLAMVKAGYVKTSKLFELLKCYQNEDEYIVWDSIIDCFYQIYNLVHNSEILLSYTEFVRNILQQIYQSLGWESSPQESYSSGLLRNLVLETLIFYDDEEVIEKAQKIFSEHQSTKKIIEPDLRQAIYKAEAKKSTKDVFATMMNMYLKTDLQEEKLRISKALGMFKDVDLINNVLHFSISKEVKPQDTVFILLAASQTQSGREETWLFFKENFVEINSKLSGNSSLLSRMVKGIVKGLVLYDWAIDVGDFFSSQSINHINKTIHQSLEIIYNNAAWLERDIEDITKVFSN